MAFDSNAALQIEDQTHDALSRRISRFALQQRSRIEHSDADEGARRLMWALLKDALRCYHTYVDSSTVRGQKLFRETDRWLRSRDLRWVFSFENVCAVLDIDSDYLRNELDRWRRSRRRSTRREEVNP